MLNRHNLHAYQERGIEWFKEKGRCALFLDMGMGKTATTLTAIQDVITQSGKVLIVAPLRVANTVWKQEIEKWEHLSLKAVICTGTASERIEAFKQQADIYIINKDSLVWLIENAKKWPFKTVIIDESSTFKSRGSKLFKAMKPLSQKSIERILLLTGTPSPNGLVDLWSQIYLIDGGQRLGKTFSDFKARWFTETGYMGYKLVPREGAEEEIRDKIKDICLTMKAEDYLELPERIDIIHSVSLSNKHFKQYKEFEEELIMSLESGVDIVSPTAGVLINKLLQYSNGAIYDAQKNVHLIHDEKIEALKEIIEVNENENFLVSYTFKSDLERLKKAFPEAVELDKNEETVNRWNKGQIKMLLAHPACLHPDTKVLTEFRGWVNIINVQNNEKVFDGVEFVSHSGCYFSGIKPIINKYGISLTPNHKLLINNEWIEAKNVRDCENIRKKARYTYTGNDSYLSKMLPLWKDTRSIKTECYEGKQSKKKTLCLLPRRNISPNDIPKNMENMARYDSKDFKNICAQLQKLWWKGSYNFKGMVGFQKFLSRYGAFLQGKLNIGQDRQFKRVFQGKLPMGNKYGTTIQQTEQQVSNVQWRENSYFGILQTSQNQSLCYNNKIKQRNESRRNFRRLQKFPLSQEQKISKVYDLVDCGPRNRFLVKNEQGEVFISHNSASYGLNLQKGGSCIIWFGLTWALEQYQQFNGRLYRQGQEKPVRIIHIIAKGCVDEKIMKVLKTKAKTQDALLIGLKEAFLSKKKS